MQKNTFPETEKLTKLMKKYAVPCVISLLVGALYNIVDQIFIANAADLGSCGNAANTAVFPLTVIALAVAVMIGDGCSTFLSMSLGRGETDRAGESVGSGVLLTLLSSVLLAAVYFAFSRPILSFFGAAVNEQTFAMAKEYFFWITAGLPFCMFGQGLNPVIRADGSPKFAMFATLCGAFTNIILDPVFIYSFHWGMAGAAIATVIGQILTAALTAYYLHGMHSVYWGWGDLRINPPVAKQYLPLGMTSFLSQISVVASMAAVNTMVMKYSLLDPVFCDPALTQIPMAVIGIVMKFFQIVISVTVGTAAGCAPIAAYNTGAGHNRRVKDLFTLLLKTEALTGLTALFIAEVLPGYVIQLFGAAGESAYYTDFAVKAFRIYLCMIVPACINKACFIYLQALGKAGISSALSMFREVVLGVALPIILPVFFGLDGILYSMPAADLTAFLITVFAIVSVYRMPDETQLTVSPAVS